MKKPIATKQSAKKIPAPKTASTKTVKKEVYSIRHKIHAIKTLQFAIFERADSDDLSNHQGHIALEYKKTEDSNIFYVSARIEISEDSEDSTPFAMIEVACLFKIHADDAKKLVKGDKTILAGHFARHLASIVVSTARGIFHEKTQDTIVNSVIIPLVNLEKIVKNDIEL